MTSIKTPSHVFLVISFLAFFGAGCSSRAQNVTPTPTSIETPTTYSTPTSTTPIVFSLSSPAITPNHPIPYRYTCDGVDVNPPLSIIDVPTDAKSLALIVTDSDARNFVHWKMWNIDPNTHFIEESTTPTGAIQGTNDFDTQGYGGPCPPPKGGVHQYVFTLYALDAKVENDIDTALKTHAIEKTELIGTYERK